MSVRHGLLALLAGEPAHGYGLKSDFERITGSAWPLNVGQVYTTLARLERDGLVTAGDAADDSSRTWRITRDGRAELAAWYGSPVDDRPARDELAIKVLVAIAAGSVDVTRILQAQRKATVERLQEWTRSKRQADPEHDLAFLLLLDALILKAEAEVKWLDLCEERLRRRKPRGRA